MHSNTVDLTSLNRPRLVATAARIVGENDAEDVVQEAMIRLLRGQFEGRAKLQTYMTRIVVNAALNWRRQHQDRPGPDLPEGHVDTPEAETAVLQALAGLAPRWRNILAYPIDGAPAALAAGTVKSQTHRAKRALEQLLLEDA